MCSGSFSINSKTGICVGKIEYQLNGEYSIQVENVGDMVRSTYLFL